MRKQQVETIKSGKKDFFMKMNMRAELFVFIPPALEPADSVSDTNQWTCPFFKPHPVQSCAETSDVHFVFIRFEYWLN